MYKRCSSLTGLYLELGPCSINPGADNTTFNPYSWNNKANIFFLDQPTNTGYSYGDYINSTFTAAENVYAFLQIFFQELPKYANLDFHIAGESYAGHYIPAIASDIIKYNNNNGSRKDIVHINLESILIGNGWVNPLVQYKYYPDMACNSSYGRVLDDSTCSQMRQDYTQCAELINKFYLSNNIQDSFNAQDYCESKLYEPYEQTGRDVYDIRCSNNCDLGLDIDKYSNREDVKTQLGVNSSLIFNSCKGQPNFRLTGDYLRPFDIDIPLLLGSNIRVLIYAGDADFICNWFGNEAWTKELKWNGAEGFKNANTTPWITNSTGEHAGDVTTFEGLTFLKVFKAGHLVPHYQPVASLDFFNRWISKNYL
ncbi:Alpha/Beta hydrolase protein [Gigaspora rosea]|uniref:Carboxypeptidase n=1 Tax=Gigaspora rosea TaxID=44941 RepID=A0A397W042_9GLOM|nr:Alpha/Beta hydrolase protein [Gigaspora rosea]